LTDGVCRVEPTIPLDAESEYTFDYREFQGLSITEKKGQGFLIPIAVRITTGHVLCFHIETVVFLEWRNQSGSRCIDRSSLCEVGYKIKQ
jgi:hypothetical protein